MRFSILFITICSTFICSNAFNIRERGDEDVVYLSYCYTFIENINSLLSSVINKFEKTDWQSSDSIAGTTNVVKNSLSQNLDYASARCCYKISEKVEYTFEVLNTMVDKYIESLLYLKSKKPLAEKNKEPINAFIKEISSQIASQLDCMYSNASPKHKLEVENLSLKFSKVDTDVKKIYGI